MPRIPDAALGGPADQPWRRYVEGGLESLEQALNRLESDSSASGKGLAATADGLARQLQAVAAQQVQLANQQAQILAAVDAIPTPRADQATASGFDVTTSWVTVASLSIPRPSGKPGANVSVSGYTSVEWLSASGTSWPAMKARILINGNPGMEAGVTGAITAGSSLSGIQSGSCAHVLSGSGSGSITAELQIRISGWVTGSGPVAWTATSAQIVASSIFTK